jgi:hypothetical protein
MAFFFQIVLAVIGFVLSFFGAGYVALCAIDTWRLIALPIYGTLMMVAFYVLCRSDITAWVRRPVFGFALACPLLVATASYGQPVLTVLTGMVAAVVLLSVLRNGFGLSGKSISIAWMSAFVLPVFIFTLDHAFFAGRMFVFKWSQIEHPFFWSPYKVGEPERHGRKCIYVYDWNGADPCAVAIVWGWSIYPKFVDLGDKRPEGSLLGIPAIQNVMR